ncbi:MAG: hypothetical protein NTY22_03555 [Proteobacteria bacterium]|nr:hypothetical protein [Pseudomonadota bacterium]
MKIFINYPFGNTELEINQRSKKLFAVSIMPFVSACWLRVLPEYPLNMRYS